VESIARASRSRFIAIGIAVVFTLFVAAMAFGAGLSRSGEILSSPSAPVSLTESVETLANHVIAIDGGDYEYVQFGVPADASTGIVRGSYHTTGSGQRIYAMILGEEDFEKWQGDQQMPEDFFYYSGEIKAANIEADVPAGATLYLIFDNTSMGMAKSVDANIELFYMR
jgi:hypothetical protein